MILSEKKKVFLRKLTRFGGQSLVSPFLLSVPLSAPLLPSKEHFSQFVIIVNKNKLF